MHALMASHYQAMQNHDMVQHWLLCSQTCLKYQNCYPTQNTKQAAVLVPAPVIRLILLSRR